MTPARNLHWAEGRSVHVGLNRVDRELYQGALPDLSSAEGDAGAMRDLANSMGCSTRVLVGDDATRDQVVSALGAILERTEPGDFVMITYSGHMTTLPGAGDDPDGWDEAWCLHDGVLLDDEFHDLLATAPEGSDILVVTDSCFAAGLVDGPGLGAPARGGAASWVRGQSPRSIGPAATLGVPVPAAPDATTAGPPGRRHLARSGEGATAERRRRELARLRPHCVRTGLPEPEVLDRARAFRRIAARAPRARLGDAMIASLVRSGALPRGHSRPADRREAIRARVVALAAASEDSAAYEGDGLGLFTAALLDVLEERDRDVTYSELLETVAGRLRLQRPSGGVFGAADLGALDARAFATHSAHASVRSGRARMFDEDPDASGVGEAEGRGERGHGRGRGRGRDPGGW